MNQILNQEKVTEHLYTQPCTLSDTSPGYHSTLKATYTTLTIHGFSYLMLSLPPPTLLIPED